MYILAFDLGLTKEAPTAAALVQFADRPVVCWTKPVLVVKNATAWEQRIGAIGLAMLATARSCTDLHALAYEAPHFTIDAQTLRKLAAIEGCALFIAAAMQLPVYAIQPSEAKVALAGHGSADKAMMIAAAARLGVAGLPSHEADAIGVALAAEAQLRRARLVAGKAAA